MVNESSFKETDLGLIPDDWDLDILGNLFEIQQGKSVSPKSRKGVSPRPFLRTANVFWGRIDVTELDRMDFSDGEVEKLALRKDDLLVCEGGDIGRTAIWENQTPLCMYQNHLHRLRTVRDDVRPEFYMYWMQAALTLLGFYEGAGNKTTIPNLSRSRLSAFLVPFPEKCEQDKIVLVLKKFQQAITEQEQTIAKTKELKRSLMHRLFTRGLRGEELKETEIGSIPKSWKIVSFGETADFKNGINFGADQKGNKGIATIDVFNMYGESIFVNTTKLYKVDIDLSDKPDYLLRDNDILFVRSSLKNEGVGWTSLFKTSNEKITFCGFIIRARLTQNNIDAKFLTYFFRSDVARRLLVSSERVAITNINQGILRSFSVPLPKIEEQKEIVNILLNIDQKIQQAVSREQSLKSLFKAMLNNLMTGQVRVKDIDFGEINV